MWREIIVHTTKISTTPKVILIALDHHRQHTSRNYHIHVSPGRSKANSYEYWTVAVAEIFNEWIVPSGYEANESQRAAGLKMINRTWRRYVAKTGDDLEES
jgi:hypothetical protein